MADTADLTAGTEASSLDAVIKLLGLVTGSGKTTVTESKGMSQEGLAGLLKQSLESNQGLAQVLGGQNASGLYNSSTNQLLANDLVSRLTAQAQANSMTSTRTQQTQSPLANVGPKTAGAGAAAVLVNNLMKGAGAVSKTNEAAKSSLGQAVIGKAKEWISPSTSAATTDMTGFMNAEATPNLINTGADSLGITGQAATGADLLNSDLSSLLGGSATQLGDAGSSLGSFLFADAPATQTAADAATSTGDTASNFPSATSATGSQTLGTSSGNSAGVADATTVGSSAYNSIATSGQGLGTATQGISYSSAPASTGSLDVGYDLGSGLGEVSGEAGTASTAATSSTDIFGGAGSNLGYLGSAMYALNAPNNPRGEQEKDYREAVGSAVLNYFGWGWATPIVDAVARPILDEATTAGESSMGVTGAMMADPVGTPISGRYDINDLATSGMDPGNLFGGNPGGSPEQFVGMTADPIGAALGGEGANGAITDLAGGINDAIGKVVCTELCYQDKLSVGLYKLSTSDALTLTGQTLRGYHVIGVPMVRLIRKSEWWANKIAPYVSDYIRHKAGEWNLRGFVVKSILHPVSWVLGFFNRDPSYYRVLYRRERKV